MLDQAIQLVWIFFQPVTKTRDIRSWEWRIFFVKPLVLPLLRKIEIPPIHCRNLKYVAGQEIRPGPTKHGDII